MNDASLQSPVHTNDTPEVYESFVKQYELLQKELKQLEKQDQKLRVMLAKVEAEQKIHKVLHYIQHTIKE